MTKIVFLGTGSAEDGDRNNTAYLIKSPDGYVIQVDVGGGIYNSLFRQYGFEGLVSKPDHIILTHDHPDHTKDIPVEVLAFWKACSYKGKDVARDVNVYGEGTAIDNFLNKERHYYATTGGRKESFVDILYNNLRFNLQPDSGEEVSIGGYKIRSAETKHGVRNLAFRFDGFGNSFAISGDGKITSDAADLCRGVDFLIWEGFTIEDDPGSGHESVKRVLEYATESGIYNVAIVHMDVPQRYKTDLLLRYSKSANDVNLFYANDGETFGLKPKF